MLDTLLDIAERLIAISGTAASSANSQALTWTDQALATALAARRAQTGSALRVVP